MIDSVIYYEAATKVGTLATIVTDFGGSNIKRFVRNFYDDAGNLSPGINAAEVIRTDILTSVEPRVALAGIAAIIATEDQSLADLLWALPLGICRVQLRRETASVIRTNVPLATLRTLQLDPVFAGSKYNFPTIS